jgi:hypothetical protein
MALSKDKIDLGVFLTRVTSHIGHVKEVAYEFHGDDKKSGKRVEIKSMKDAAFVDIYDERPMEKFKFPKKFPGK